MEEKFKKWKKGIAYLKDIDAYDYRDNGMISILLDFDPDEVHKEITMKYATVGSNAIDLRTAMLEVERIIEREKDRVQSRRDRQTRVRSQRSRRRLPKISTYGTTKLTAGSVDSCLPPGEWDKEKKMKKRLSRREV